MRTGVILAGGRSSRFGLDKLAADLDGTPLLSATIVAVASVTDGVIVAGTALPRGHQAGDIAATLVHDREPFAGPLVALANVLDQARPDPEHLLVIVGGDMPRVVPAVLGSLLDRLAADPGIDAVVLERPSEAAEGVVEPRRAVLPLAVREIAAARAATAALAAGERSLHALVDRLAYAELPAPVWLRLDPGGDTLLDVDTEADLDRIRASKSG